MFIRLLDPDVDLRNVSLQRVVFIRSDLQKSCVY